LSFFSLTRVRVRQKKIWADWAAGAAGPLRSAVRRTEKIPKVPFSENGSLKEERNPKNPNKLAQPLSSGTPQKVN
jgi:hypothetical protein